jgi:hypothetical protein
MQFASNSCSSISCSLSPTSLLTSPRRKRFAPRRGVAVVIVLALVAVSLGLAYASLRVQANGQQLQANATQQVSAREAALSGMNAALRKMHQSDWAGVGTTLSASIDADTRFEVAFTTGDSDLAVGDTRYNEYPYRVTLVSTGYHTDNGTAARATHRLRVVVMLNPRAVAADPTDWSYAQTYTFCQRDNSQFRVNMPFQFNGTTRIQGTMDLCKDYSNFDSAAASYLNGLNAIFLQGSDCRPFTGAIHWKAGDQSGNERNWVTSNLSLSTVDTARHNMAAWSTLAPNATYKLYPGGASYNVASIAQDVGQNTTLQGDPLTNPLGIFYHSGNVNLNRDVSIQGTLIADGAGSTVTIAGSNVQLQTADLPALFGTTTAVRIPTLITTNLTQNAGGSASINGFAYVEESVDIARDTQLQSFALTGKMVARDVRFRERTQWGAVDWNNAAFLWNLLPIGKALFPIYMDTLWNVKKEPLIVFKPNTTARSYHWLTRGTPLYAVGATDSGLCWDIISWKDNQ